MWLNWEVTLTRASTEAPFTFITRRKEAKGAVITEESLSTIFAQKFTHHKSNNKFDYFSRDIISAIYPSNGNVSLYWRIWTNTRTDRRQLKVTDPLLSGSQEKKNRKNKLFVSFFFFLIIVCLYITATCTSALFSSSSLLHLTSVSSRPAPRGVDNE